MNQLTTELTDLKTIQEKVAARGGTPTVEDALTAELLQKRIALVEEATESSLKTLRSLLELRQAALAARRNAPELAAVPSNLFTIHGDPRRAKGLWKKYLTQLRSTILSNPKWLLHNDLVVVDNAYGGDPSTYISNVQKGWAINYHPTLFSMNINPRVFLEALDNFVPVLDRLLEILEEGETAFARNVQIQFFGTNFLGDTFSSPNDLTRRTFLSGSLSWGELEFPTFHPLVAELFKSQGILLPPMGEETPTFEAVGKYQGRIYGQVVVGEGRYPLYVISRR